MLLAITMIDFFLAALLAGALLSERVGRFALLPIVVAVIAGGAFVAARASQPRHVDPLHDQDIKASLDELNRGVGELNRGVGNINLGVTDLNRQVADINSGVADLNRGVADLRANVDKLADVPRALADLGDRMSRLENRAPVIIIRERSHRGRGKRPLARYAGRPGGCECRRYLAY